MIVMLEFHSTVDWFMALRIQSYAVRVYEAMPESRSPTSESRLPPILAVVVYNGRSTPAGSSRDWKTTTSSRPR